jgi:hypothetical protein
MAQTVKLKRSAVAGRVPDTGSMSLGELAVNTKDGKLYFLKDDDGQSVESILTTSAPITGSLQIDTLTVNNDFNYGNTVWNENNGINSMTGSGFIFKSGTPPELELYNGSDELVFKVDNKVISLSPLNVTPTAVAGGMFYSGSNEWYLGYE